MKKLFIVLCAVVVAVAVYAGARKSTNTAEVSVPTASTTVATSTTAIAPSISISPDTILQGDPAEIVINGAQVSDITSLTYNGKSLGVFVYNGKPTAFVGIDLRAASGSYPVVLTLKDGTTLKKSLVVGTRTIAKAPLGIPPSLGGNTTAGEQNLLSSLAHDNAILNAIPSADKALWSEPFQFPVTDPVVTDTYGYTRLTVNSTISHKGTDFHAPPGTPVMAMNSGVVALARSFTSYGNTIVIDHGFGLQTLYMHLSEIDVQAGDTVEKGQVIGKSGETGYAEGPHLHISVKMNSISIDPMKFMAFFQ